MDFETVACGNCGHVVLDAPAVFKGMVRVICTNRRCRRRNWVASDGKAMRVVFVDKAPPRIE